MTICFIRRTNKNSASADDNRPFIKGYLIKIGKEKMLDMIGLDYILSSLVLIAHHLTHFSIFATHVTAFPPAHH